MKHFKLLRSCVRGKMPNPDTMDYGEIAINFNAEEPFISFKNTDDEMVKIGNSSINEDEFIKWSDEIPSSKITEALGYTPAPSDALQAYATKQELNDYALKSDIPDLTLYIKNTQLPIYLRNYVLKNELPNLDGYVKNTDEIPSSKIIESLGFTPAQADELQAYATKQELNDYALKSELPSLEEYVKSSDEIPSQKILDALGYTPAQADELQAYVTKQELNDYPTRDEINAIIGQINTQLTAI